MFTYIHGYHPACWRGLVQRGLIDDTSGVKLAQCCFHAAADCFNAVAAPGGELHGIVKEANRAFYVDRLQGGVFFHGYTFDKRLVALYQAMLGDTFYGFQMHEWMSNISSDWSRLAEAGCIGKSAGEITRAILEKYPYAFPFLEAHSAEEYSRLERPETPKALVEQATALFAKRQGECDGLLLPADSYFMAPRIELALGARRLMPEVGAQIPDTRVQFAYTRGMARAKGIPWGAYYEPWGGDPFGTCNYKRDGGNEWNLPDDGSFPFDQHGESGGSSRSLQARIHRYAFMSGAGFVSEEWGLCNTFYDWEDFELSPYGRVKKDFIDFTRRMPEIKPYNPVALTLPRDLEVLEIGHSPNRYLNFPADPQTADTLKKVWENLGAIFQNPNAGRAEGRIMQNSGFPDAFDILHADDEAAAGKYKHAVDLTGSIAGLGETVDRLMPCRVTGNVHWLVSQTDKEWLISIFNNNGVLRSVEKGETLDDTAGVSAEMVLKNGGELKWLDGSRQATQNDGVWRVALPAGGWFIASFPKDGGQNAGGLFSHIPHFALHNAGGVAQK